MLWLALWVVIGLLSCYVNARIEVDPFSYRSLGVVEHVWFAVPVCLGPLTLLWVAAKITTRSGSARRLERERQRKALERELAESQAEVDRLLKERRA